MSNSYPGHAQQNIVQHQTPAQIQLHTPLRTHQTSRMSVAECLGQLWNVINEMQREIEKTKELVFRLEKKVDNISQPLNNVEEEWFNVETSSSMYK